MKDISSGNFGIIIAFLVPGFIGLWGIAAFSPIVKKWLGIATDPSASGFLFVVLASLSVGVFISGIRSAILDTVFSRTGSPRPMLNFERLSESEHVYKAFTLTIENFYRYYQFYSNTAISLPLVLVAWWGVEE